jgi:NCAIR mutase (PurE)-related protein
LTPERLLGLLEEIARGAVPPHVALERLAVLDTEPLSSNGASPYARLDHHRAVRVGFPEVVYCPGKTTEQVLTICERLAASFGGFIATRASVEVANALHARFADARVHDVARIVHLPAHHAAEPHGAPVLVASAGTADLPVAEEAAVTAEALGNPVRRVYDVGVAGLHRLLAENEALREAAVIIAVAGMEGALPSVIGGLVQAPVIAVPTSVGYGTSFGGIAALLAMLNSCASGVTVVNIDNGFGAACAATRIRHALHVL